MPEVASNNPPSPDPLPIPPRSFLEGKHAVRPVHLHSGAHDSGPALHVIRISSLSPEAQALCSNTRGTPSPGADGAHGSTDKWLEVNLGTTWEDYGPRLQIPKGYTLYKGADYIPFDIHLPSGEMKPTKYIKLEYGEDPLIYGMIDGDPQQYVESFQATPFPSAGPLRTYTSGQLEFFEDDHDLHPKVDNAVYHLYDKSVMAEVECYWINKKKLKREYEELWQVQHDIWKHELMLGGCAQCMAGAQIYQHIKVVNRARLHILMDEYKAHRCGR